MLLVLAAPPFYRARLPYGQIVLGIRVLSTVSITERSSSTGNSLGSLARKLGIERKLTEEERDRKQFDRFNQRVGIKEYVDPKGSGGFIRGKMEDWEVREVGMDGKVARMRIEPMRPCWIAVEQLHLEDGNPSTGAVDPRSLSAGEDSTQDLLDAFDHGYALGDSAAASFISLQCSEDAMTRIEQFVKRATGRKTKRDVRGLLCNFQRTTPDSDLAEIYKIRGAIAWMLRQTFAMMPMKILPHEVLFYGATEVQRSKLIIECVHRDDAVELMRFILRGFNDGNLTVRLVRGMSTDQFSRELTAQFENLDVSAMTKPTTAPQVILSWQRKHSPVGLFNAQRWRFVLKKTGWDTNSLQRAVEQNLRLPSNSLHYGGTKDRFGVTYQYMTLPTTHDEQRIREAFDDISRGASRMCEADNFEVNTGPAKLRQGLSLGNCFRVRIRGAEPGVGKELSSIGSQGFINYYGLQRFGINPNHGEERHCNVDIGGAIISGQYEKAVKLIMSPADSDRSPAAEIMKQWSSDRDIAKALEQLGGLGQLDANAKIWKGILLLLMKNRGPDRYRIALKGGVPRNVTLLYLSAYQSYLWNQLASQRMRQGGLELMDGDLLLSPVSGDVTRFESNNAGQYEIQNVIIPTWGHRIEGKSPLIHLGIDPHKMYRGILEESVERGEITERVLNNPESCDVSRALGYKARIDCYLRPLVVRPTFFSASEEDNDTPSTCNLVLDFHLPSGSFATMLLREVMDHPRMSHVSS